MSKLAGKARATALHEGAADLSAIMDLLLWVVCSSIAAAGLAAAGATACLTWHAADSPSLPNAVYAADSKWFSLSADAKVSSLNPCCHGGLGEQCCLRQWERMNCSLCQLQSMADIYVTVMLHATLQAMIKLAQGTTYGVFQ